MHVQLTIDTTSESDLRQALVVIGAWLGAIEGKTAPATQGPATAPGAPGASAAPAAPAAAPAAPAPTSPVAAPPEQAQAAPGSTDVAALKTRIQTASRHLGDRINEVGAMIVKCQKSDGTAAQQVSDLSLEQLQWLVDQVEQMAAANV